jgi:hypothetical protein
MFCLAAWTISAGPAAADHGTDALTFAEIVGQAKLVVVARISVGADGGVVLDVEHVLKGASPAHLAYDPAALAPPLEDWKRAVIAFHDPVTIDFRAPTTAWHVADDGAIDPEGFQQRPGLPATLDAMLVAFGQDPAESESEAATEPPPAAPEPIRSENNAVMLGGVAALALAAIITALVVVRRRGARTRYEPHE